MTTAIEKEFRLLTVAERVELVGELWERIASQPQLMPVSDSQIKELERRRRLYRLNPQRAIPWSQAKALLLKRHEKRRGTA